MAKDGTTRVGLSGTLLKWGKKTGKLGGKTRHVAVGTMRWGQNVLVVGGGGGEAIRDASQLETAVKDGKRYTSVDLESGCRVYPNCGPDANLAENGVEFVVVTGKRQYLFSTESPAERDRWIAAIERLIGQEPGSWEYKAASAPHM